MFYGWKPYVSAAKRRSNAEREIKKLVKKGQKVSPVVIEGRTIAKTFWGKSWCDNLEQYSDFENRLPRGRTYVRNGSVLDLQIEPGEVRALVSGSSVYKVAVKVSAVPKLRWAGICGDCAGGIDSLVELLQGRFSNGVMQRLCQQKTGLFPSPNEIEITCSCPDWATMCKHVAAVLYGIGARLDEQPELLFKLRKVHEKDLIAKAGKGIPLSKKAPAAGKVLAADNLSDLFGLEFGDVADSLAAGASTPPAKQSTTRRKAKVATIVQEAPIPAKPVRSRTAPETKVGAPAPKLRIAPKDKGAVAKGNGKKTGTKK